MIKRVITKCSRRHSLSILLCMLLIFHATALASSYEEQHDKHDSNYAIIVSTSRYYFNYRHSANALSIYDLLKTRGKFPDSNIILMLAQDYSYDARNPIKNTMFTESNTNSHKNIYNDPSKNLSPHTSIEVDYRGDEVNVDTFIRVLLGRHEEGELTSRKLPPLTNSSNIFIFLTGHGGDSFFKFQDLEEISTPDFQSIFQQMHAMNRYRSILFVTDTCQAFTLSEDIEKVAPNVISIGSSLRDENSYAHHSDRALAVSVIDRFSFHFMNFLTNSMNKDWKTLSLNKLVKSMTWMHLRSNVGIRGESHGKSVDDIMISEFFENVSRQQTINAGVSSSGRGTGSTKYDWDGLYGRTMNFDERTLLRKENTTDIVNTSYSIEEQWQNCQSNESEQNIMTYSSTLWADIKLFATIILLFCSFIFSTKIW